jgi:hypothetical protein
MVPLELPRFIGADMEAEIAPRSFSPEFRRLEGNPFDASSVISIRYDRLPYSQPITAHTTSLLLQLNEVHLTVDFIEVVSGHLLVTLVEGAADEGIGCYIAEIEDIPTDTELPLDCPHGSDELTVKFQKAHRGIICILFKWDRLLTRIT